MPRITNEQKMQSVKDFLAENGIAYKEDYISRRCGVTIPLTIPAHRIAVRIGDSQEFFYATRGKYYPVFIRDDDTKAKVLEKIQNTIIKSMTLHQKAINRKSEKQWIRRKSLQRTGTA